MSQGTRKVTTSITFGPYTSKPGPVGSTTAVSGVLIQVFPGSGSVDTPGAIIYQAGTGVDGRASILFSQNTDPAIGWAYKVIYPVGSYDSSLPTYQAILFHTLKL